MEEDITLPNTQYWTLSTTGLGQVVTDLDDVKQCIQVILLTVKGTDPLRPDFGVDILQYIDKPQNYAIPRVRQAIYEAVNLWEPRATITNIVTTPSPSGQVIFTVYWTSDVGGGSNQLTI